jgi:hypothetical protein
MIRFYARDGQPITEDQWKAARVDDRRVALDSVVCGDEAANVSTIWLGLDHQSHPDAPPLMFETMVFGGPADSWQDRYSTEAQATEGHARVVAALRAADLSMFGLSAGSWA